MMRSIARSACNTLLASIAVSLTALGVALAEGTPSSISTDRLASIKQRVAATLRVPGSAVFGVIVPARKIGYCGYVDAQNRFGERTGNRIFYAEPKDSIYFVLPSEREVRGLLPAEFDRVERLLPVTEANCIGAGRKPIMD